MDMQKIEIKPDVIKDNGLFIVNPDKIDVPFKVKEKTIVYIPAGKFGGNHMHPRTEAFVSLGGNLKLIWIDENGKQKEEMMKNDDKLFVYVIPPNLPHAVLNTTNDSFGVLIEFADGVQQDVISSELIKSL